MAQWKDHQLATMLYEVIQKGSRVMSSAQDVAKA
jgi:hypothetical protein